MHTHIPTQVSTHTTTLPLTVTEDFNMSLLMRQRENRNLEIYFKYWQILRNSNLFERLNKALYFVISTN